MSEPTPTEEFADDGPWLAENRDENRSPGEMIHEARLKQDYSIERLADETKLFRSTLEALEADDYDRLSQPVFAAGYYRQCGRILGLDENELVAAYQRYAGPSRGQFVDANMGSLGVAPTNVTPRGVGRLPRVLLIIALLLALAAAAVVVLLPSVSLPGANTSGGSDSDTNTRIAVPASSKTDQSQSSEPSSSAGGNADSSTPDISGKSSSSTGSDTGGADASDTSDATADADAQSDHPSANGDAASSNARIVGGRKVPRLFGSSDSAVARARAERPDSKEAKPASDSASASSSSSVPANELKLTFEKKSWVSVKNASGNRLFSGTFEPGDSRTFNGQPPYKITLGFAPGVHVTIGGEPVKIPDNGSVAHLTVRARQNG